MNGTKAVLCARRLSGSVTGLVLIALHFCVPCLARTSQEQSPPETSMRLILAGRFGIEVPEFAAVSRACPSSICGGESYGLTWKYFGIPNISMWVFPYEVSDTDVAGKCTVSTALDRGDPKGAIFCEGQVLTESVSTSVGPAKWIYATEPNSPTMHSGPLPPSDAFIHLFVAVVPSKKEHLLIEFYGAATGYRNLSQSPAALKIRSIMKDSLLPTLSRVDCKSNDSAPR